MGTGVQPRWGPMVTAALLRWPRRLLEIQEAVILIFDCQWHRPRKGPRGRRGACGPGQGLRGPFLPAEAAALRPGQQEGGMTVLLGNQGHGSPLLLLVPHVTLKSFVSRKPSQHLGSRNAEPRISVPGAWHCLLCEGQHSEGRGPRQAGAESRARAGFWGDSAFPPGLGESPAPSRAGLGPGGMQGQGHLSRVEGLKNPRLQGTFRPGCPRPTPPQGPSKSGSDVVSQAPQPVAGSGLGSGSTPST